MHMAMLETNAKYGSGSRFPFIVDTPRQQGLDAPNTGRLLSAVYSHAEPVERGDQDDAIDAARTRINASFGEQTTTRKGIYQIDYRTLRG